MGSLSIIGIGKLGICFALNAENAGFDVLGVDVNQEYIDSINNKTLKSTEPFVEDYLKASHNLKATSSLKEAVEFSDMLFVMVATPSLSSGRYDHSQVDRVVDTLISLGKQINSKHLVICCTVMPGYSDSVQKRLQDYNYIVSYNPEFIAQGRVMQDQKRPDMILIGEGSLDAGDKIQSVYDKICMNYPKYNRMSRKAAELTKISLNCFMTTKISFANMIGDIAVRAGVGKEADKILKAIGSDSRVGNKYLKYGFGYGGPCFPRDNRALGIFADDINAYSEISKASDICNDNHLQFQILHFRETHPITEPITISSVTYKPGVTMLDESQQLKFAVALAKAGYKVIVKEHKDVIEQLRNIYGNMFVYIERELNG